MKRIFLIILFVLLPAGFAAGAVWAGEAGTDEVTLGLKAGVIGFTADAAEALDVESGPYLGVEAFRRISDRLFLGGELGYARSTGSIPLVKTELTYIPIEFNLKYARAVTSLVTFTLGGGASYNYVRFEADCLGTCFAAEEEWLAGIQFFGGVQLNFSRYLLGVEGKVQSTEEDLDNWRLNVQAGYRFGERESARPRQEGGKNREDGR